MEQRLARLQLLAVNGRLVFLARLLGTYRLWRQRSRERAELAAMGPRAWKDIGLTPSDARREINKARWVP